eukprot:COSAG01_NODE_2960_length_6792_cov_24.183573_8_plen_266_part_00
MGMRYGQVFLRDNNILRKIISSITDSYQPVLVEIGCGDGVLSEYLLDCCDVLHIFEIDKACIEATQARLSPILAKQDKQVIYHHQDVLTANLTGLFKAPVSIVANVPYYLSAKLLKWLVKQRAVLRECVLMFQLEVVKKFVAPPNSSLYTSLSVYCQYYFAVKQLFKVSRQCFRPVPNVESAVMSLAVKHALPDIDEDLFFSMVRSCFWARRKTLKRALLESPYLKIDPAFIQEASLLPYLTKRAEVLSLDDFLSIYNIMLISYK